MLRTMALSAVTLLSLACFAACGGNGGSSSVADLSGETTSALEARVGSATELHFTVSTSVVANPPPELRITLVNDAAVRSFFAETIALPRAPAGPTSCPIDYGIAYHLVFVSGDVTTTADLDPSGCQTVTIDGAIVLSAASSPSYWYDLSRVLQVEESAIYPYDPAAHH
jgi:hypothetical protein